MSTVLSESLSRSVVPGEGLSLGLLERFAAHLQLRPEAPAIVCGARRLSYAELDAAANRLAHRLQALGVARDVPVGICLEPGTELLVAMLAVLKAGGAYLPLDPAWPRERLQHMLGVVRPAVLISCGGLRERCPVGAHQLLDLDQEQCADRGAALRPIRAWTIVPEQLCYLMFTSGSERYAEVRDGHAWQPGRACFRRCRAALDFGAGRCLELVSFRFLRLLGLGDLRRTAARRLSAGRA